MLARRIGKAKLYGQRFLAVGHVAGIDDVALGMHPCVGDIAGIAIAKSACHVPLIEVELLSFRLHEGGVRRWNVIADTAQMQTMRVGTQVVGCLARTFVILVLHAVGSFHTAVVAEVEFLQCFLSTVVLRVGKRVPTPVAHRT